MACYHPLAAYKLGGQVHFGVPISSVAQTLQLPCGQCLGCRLERSRQWATRIMFESQLHDASTFITLTYSPENLPNPPSLDYRHFQLFMKRLRKALGPLRYFAVGEYGADHFRPHFHACLFGTDFPDRQLHSRTRAGHNLYRSATLERAWPFGYSSCAELTFDSAAYVARYSLKKVNGDRAEDHYRWYDPDTGEVTQLQPEFARMSLKPGIGGRWFELYSSDVYDGHDYVVVNGRKCRPPRYFDKLLERTDPDRYAEVKAAREATGKKMAHENTPERLAVREAVREAALNQTSPRKTL